MPNLKDMPQLRVLNLATNKITQAKFVLSQQNLNNLEMLDLSNNLIVMKEHERVYDFVEKLKKFRKLTNLTLSGNPFEKTDPKHMKTIV